MDPQRKTTELGGSGENSEENSDFILSSSSKEGKEGDFSLLHNYCKEFPMKLIEVSLLGWTIDEYWNKNRNMLKYRNVLRYKVQCTLLCWI